MAETICNFKGNFRTNNPMHDNAQMHPLTVVVASIAFTLNSKGKSCFAIADCCALRKWMYNHTHFGDKVGTGIPAWRRQLLRCQALEQRRLWHPSSRLPWPFAAQCFAPGSYISSAHGNKNRCHSRFAKCWAHRVCTRFKSELNFIGEIKWERANFIISRFGNKSEG